MKKTLAFMLAVALGLSLVACDNNQSSPDGTSKDGQDTSIEYNADEFLPVGSVVLLKGGNKRIMICGRIQAQAGSDIIYDYSACYYPEGIDPTSIFLFNREIVADGVFGFNRSTAFYNSTLVKHSLCECGFPGALAAKQGNVLDFIGLINFHVIRF